MLSLFQMDFNWSFDHSQGREEIDRGTFLLSEHNEITREGLTIFTVQYSTVTKIMLMVNNVKWIRHQFKCEI